MINDNKHYIKHKCIQLREAIQGWVSAVGVLKNKN